MICYRLKKYKAMKRNKDNQIIRTINGQKLHLNNAAVTYISG